MSAAPSIEGYFAHLDAKLRQAAVSGAGRGPRQDTERLRAETLDVLATFRGSMSTRQIYYQLVSRGVLANTPASYDRVQRLVVTMRRDGAIAYERVVDRTRSAHKLAGWAGAAQLMSAAAAQFRRDAWAEQTTVVMVAIEKQALEGVFAEVCDEFGAQLWTLRGFCSESFAFEWAAAIKRHEADGQHVEILYFGDFDPSGFSIEHDALGKLRRHGADPGWERCALMPEDFDAFDLVNVPAKASDGRSRDFVAYWGPRAAELDALPPDELHDRVRSNLELFVDPAAWERTKRTEEAERESLEMVARNWDAAVRAVGGAS